MIYQPGAWAPMIYIVLVQLEQVQVSGAGGVRVWRRVPVHVLIRGEPAGFAARLDR